MYQTEKKKKNEPRVLFRDTYRTKVWAYRCSPSYKAHICYEGTTHQYTSSDTKVKGICHGQGHVLERMAVLAAFVFHKFLQTHLVLHDLYL